VDAAALINRLNPESQQHQDSLGIGGKALFRSIAVRQPFWRLLMFRGDSGLTVQL
jgi:hypothetical protein